MNGFKQILNHIPGFRSKKIWKMVIASIYYLATLVMLFDSFGLFLGSLTLPFLIFSAIDLIKYKKKNLQLKTALISFVIPLIVFIFATSITPSVNSESSLNESSTQNENVIEENKKIAEVTDEKVEDTDKDSSSIKEENKDGVKNTSENNTGSNTIEKENQESNNTNKTTEQSDTSTDDKQSSNTNEKTESDNSINNNTAAPSNNTSTLASLKVHFIDVGQGDSIFIDYGDYDILIDAGDNDKGQLVVNYLKSLKTDDIEIMVATHCHADHIGGLDDVLAAFDVETIIDSGEIHTTKTFKDYLNAVKLEKQEADAKFIEDKDMQFALSNDVIFKVIELGDNYDDTNNNSVVCMLDYKDIEFLFTGDLEADIERANLNKFSDIDILKVGHHGSNTSSSEEFLNVVKPEVAVISAGEDNKYGHPHIETLVRLANHVDNIYGTWKSGNIIVTTDGTDYEINTTAPIDVDEFKSTDVNATVQTKESSTQTEKKEYMFVGSSESDKFHYPDCRWAKKIKPENLIKFKTREEAINAGYKPCGTCKP